MIVILSGETLVCTKVEFLNARQFRSKFCSGTRISVSQLECMLYVDDLVPIESFTKLNKQETDVSIIDCFFFYSNVYKQFYGFRMRCIAYKTKADCIW